jgi:CRISPR-associated protein (TIGR03986 family)
MSMKKHGEVLGTAAIAPYNFVELPEKIVKAEALPDRDRYYSDRYTGKIECKLTTSSPLYIRCGMTPTDFTKFGGKSDENPANSQSDKEFEVEKRKALAPFFRNPANQHPTIPGSSLRGMLRTLVEIISYSKIEQVSDRQLIYRAFADTTSLGEFYRDRLLKAEDEEKKKYSFLMRAGYMIQQGSDWAIQPAKELTEGASFARIAIEQIKELWKRPKRPWAGTKHAHRISVHVDSMKWHSGKGDFIQLYYAKASSLPSHGTKCDGVLVETGGLPGKKKLECVLGLPDTEQKPIAIPSSMIQDYREQMTKEQIKLLGKDGVLKLNHPVFYLIENDELVFFGHTMMFRLPYEKSIQEFIPSNILNDNDQSTFRDIATSIFGFVKREKNEQDQNLAGRVYVSDAICTQTADQDIWLKNDATGKSITPQILATPKPTTFQHYLVQPDPDKLKHYANKPSHETVIRGHKLYWHKGNVQQNQIEESNQDKIKESRTQYTEIQPIKDNVCFDFEINFENLSKVELGALLWVLNIAQDDQYRLSLGMGKPLGMGGVKISSKLYLNDRYLKDPSSRYTKLFDGNQWITGYRTASPPNIEALVAAFERYICEAINSKAPLKEVRRIKMLLTMLNWQNYPSFESTRYMEIERDTSLPYIGTPKSQRDRKINEYSRRPILPTPFQVLGDLNRDTVKQPSVRQKVLSEREAEIQAAIATSQFVIGDKTAAIVRGIKKGTKNIKVTYEIVTTTQKLSEEVVLKKAAALSTLTEGQSVEVKIIELHDDGRIKKVKLV